MECLIITESVKQNLLSATKWLKFLTVLGTISLVLMLIAAIACLFIPDNEEGAVFGVIYLVICALYFYPLKKCYSITRTIRDAMDNDSQDSLEICADNVRTLLKYLGILAIVLIVSYVLFSLVFLIGIVSSIL